MEPVKCVLCLCNCSPGIKLAENLLNTDGIETFSQGAKADIPVRSQLQIIFLLRKILELPQEKCSDFLRDYGDPSSWINCCDSCSTLVGKCRIIFDQIMKLQKQFEHLQKAIKNIIIRSSNSDDAKDDIHWGRGVQGEMRYFINKEFYQAHPIKEEFVGDLPCHNITINNKTVSENILGCFSEEIGNTELQQNSLIEVQNGCPTDRMNSLLYDANNCDSEEQGPLRGIYREDELDNQQYIQNAQAMYDGGYFQSKTTILGTPFFSHLPEYNPENSISTSSNASMYAGDKTFRCNICGGSFCEFGNLHDHICISTETKPYINEGLSGVSNLEGPNSIHSEENSYIYLHDFCAPKDLNDHISTQTTNNTNDKQNKRDGFLPTKHKCRFCEKSFSQSIHLKSHERIHTGEKPYRCQFCEKSFSLSRTRKHHERTHTGEKPFKCKFCEKSFSRADHLKEHERIHTGEKPYKCALCEKSFSTSQSLRKHERIHAVDFVDKYKPFKCQFCERGFTQSINLKNHERLHTGETPYKCRFCEKKFSQATSLIYHERIHTGEKPYKCGFCEKCFSQVNNLKLHEKTHTGKKPYKCKLCEKCYTNATNLKLHERTHAEGNSSNVNFVRKTL